MSKIKYLGQLVVSLALLQLIMSTIPVFIGKATSHPTIRKKNEEHLMYKTVNCVNASHSNSSLLPNANLQNQTVFGDVRPTTDTVLKLEKNGLQCNLGNGSMTRTAQQDIDASEKNMFGRNTNTSWFTMPVGDGRDLLYVWSAFYDDRPSPHVVRILALAPLKYRAETPLLNCGVKVTNGSMKETDQVYETTYDNNGYIKGIKYKVLLIMCVLNDFTERSINYVTLRDAGTNATCGLVPVRFTKPRNTSKFQHNFTVCVQPMHSQFGRTKQELQNFVEFIETSALMGATKFQLYLFATHQNFDTILETYSQIESITFKLPYADFPVWSHAQLLCLLDCFYSNMWTSKYIVTIDVDEMVVPRKDNNWLDLVTRVMTRNKCTSFVEMNFKHVLFPPNLCDIFRHPQDFPYIQFRNENPEMIIRRLQCVVRESKPWPHLMRSKYIADPRLVDYPSIHLVRRNIYETQNVNIAKNMCQTINVKVRDGYIFHHRLWNKRKWINSTETKMEYRMLHFAESITSAISERLRFLKNNYFNSYQALV